MRQHLFRQCHAFVRRPRDGKAADQVVIDEEVDLGVVIAVEVEVPPSRSRERRLDSGNPRGIEG